MHRDDNEVEEARAAIAEEREMAVNEQNSIRHRGRSFPLAVSCSVDLDNPI